MGKNSNKPVHKSQIARGGGGADADEEQKPFHSKEYEQAQLESLLAGSSRPSWEEFKEQQRKRGELEGAEDRLEEEAQRRFRAELDEARNARLGAAEKSSDKKHKHKHKKDKDKKKHSKRERSDESDSDSELPVYQARTEGSGGSRRFVLSGWLSLVMPSELEPGAAVPGIRLFSRHRQQVTGP
jgi:hypothetical protein